MNLVALGTQLLFSFRFRLFSRFLGCSLKLSPAHDIDSIPAEAFNDGYRPVGFLVWQDYGLGPTLD